MDPERQRQAEQRRRERRWDLFGPYLAERAWATVREDYSDDGDVWRYFPHDHARSRAYRWNEDGLLGISDEHQRLCFALALWNERDPILKERLFGVTGPQGNHGEDVKEVYFYLDNTPTHSYMRALYKYPQAAFPYERLLAENARRRRDEPEFELVDTGVFDGGRYFDVFVEYAKAGPTDILVQITAHNRGPDPAPLHLLPTLWFRNTWAWSDDPRVPTLTPAPRPDGLPALVAEHRELGELWFVSEAPGALLFTDNETNAARLFGADNRTPHVKDAFHRHVVDGESGVLAAAGTKSAVHLRAVVAPGASWTVRLRLSPKTASPQCPDEPVLDPELAAPFADFDALMRARRAEADTFYDGVRADMTVDERQVFRQAIAGLLWSKQFYHYVVRDWLAGDPAQPPPPRERTRGRNTDWRHLYNHHVLSMPDTWEYPWYAAWDLAFHCIPLALVDPEFAKSQLDLLTREWFLHPNGAMPAYEWNFSDVNPPVFAWATWRVYKIEQRHGGKGDRAFLEAMFHKLLLHFTWWVNRKDSAGKNIFQGGFLGLDNIGVFDRSAGLPSGGVLEQSDATAWMGMFSLNMMTMALELARENPVYEKIASKFFEHFLSIADAMNNLGGEGIGLWDDQDEFFYDVLHLPDGRALRLRARSLVGLIPLLAVETIEPLLLEQMPGFRHRLEWFLAHRPDLARLVSRWYEPGAGERRLLALVRGSRMKRLLRRMLDPGEFLSDYGVRSMSKIHATEPYRLHIDGATLSIGYEPGESQTGLFGGNSNWRGPVWFPINFLLIEALQKFHHYYSDDFRVECPTGSGHYLSIREIADELSRRLTRIFLPDAKGRRPYAGDDPRQHDPHWRDHLLFHEYFHGDTGQGLGASHQTGWTALVAKLLLQQCPPPDDDH
ncbi:MGH1-like glycoside hydrolase domain-containing protein [Nannocystis bainbridge]|uniref:Glucosidase n=1 Tax=Nannocystis bainbridge TaxID=2995303 RepID=A0ABT5DXT5_9BACT|nr:glucosidase [Nannocystis bainbridge]MDC0718422.1 glucosidase [Nannocystis bainbridge]